MSEQPILSTADRAEQLAAVLTGEIAQTIRDLREQREARRPGAVDRLSGSVEKLSRAANSLQVTSMRMREASEALARERARLAKEDSELLAQVLTRFFAGVDVELCGPLRELLGVLLREARRGDELVVDDATRDAARGELREQVGKVLVERGDVELREGPKLLGPGAPHPDGRDDDEREVDGMIGPRRAVRALRERVSRSKGGSQGDPGEAERTRANASGEGAVSGEVVDAGVGRKGWRAVEEAAVSRGAAGEGAREDCRWGSVSSDDRAEAATRERAARRA